MGSRRHGDGAIRGCIALAVLGLALPGAAPARAQLLDGSVTEAVRNDVADRLRQLRDSLEPRRGGILGLMGHTIIPDGSANAVQVNRVTTNAGEGRPALTLSQFGFGFTVSESFPLYLEIYAGYARYDPRALIVADGMPSRPSQWNNFTGTLGIGYDIQLSETFWVRPILNVAGGYAAADTALLAGFVSRRRGRDLGVLDDLNVTAGGIGGAVTLAYYDYRPEREIEAELRFSQIDLQTISDTLGVSPDRSTSRTIGLWTRYRWPTGAEAFGRPVRWVLDNSFSYYLGDQQDALTFRWAAKLGGGIEFDTGRSEFGALGMTAERVRFIGRYFIGDGGVNGVSFGIGISL